LKQLGFEKHALNLKSFVLLQLVMGTMKDLHKFYPEIIPSSQLSEVKGASIDKV
jgi:formin 2/Wiskott-Aldrich syndrome protein